MKTALSALLSGLLLLILPLPLSLAQKTDSIKQVIQSEGYEFPRLSPIPLTVNGLNSTILSLNGQWKFSENGSLSQEMKNIEVPGEWFMQGYNVNPGEFALYLREFEMPADWKGKRIKLRCDAVYSECEIYVNGMKAGDHLGGFTAFETDITQYLTHGKPNQLSLRVRNESLADSLASGSQYAVHPLGGITRKIYLVALPEINASMFHISTSFDKDYRNALLKVEFELANESGKTARSELRFFLTKPGDPSVLFERRVKIKDVLKAGTTSLHHFSFDIRNPGKWDPEHPNLYTLRAELISDKKTVEIVERNFGFRQVEVRGNQVFVNNMPIKLRGACRHEAMPLRGRSVSEGQWEEDVSLFRMANMNYIRTSHYPPAQELIEACDSLGMFVEVEAPFCWAHRTEVPEEMHFKALVMPQVEMLNTFRSNPSVLMWSLANESQKYEEYYRRSAELVKAMDPTRPRVFSHVGPVLDNGELEIGNDHYPGPEGPGKYANAERPVTFDEFCHLNSYNRFELVADPGIRDVWGIGLEWMWEKMYYAKGVLGGALWAGIDDSFFPPDGRALGYGTWGVFDGWRRFKPEYWQVKKVYSPVKIKQTGNWDPDDKSLSLEIENRMLFSDLSECIFNYKAGDKAGSFSASAKPGAKDTIRLNIPKSEKVYVEVIDPRGFLADQYEFTISPELRAATMATTLLPEKKEDTNTLKLVQDNTALIVDKPNNKIKGLEANGRPVIIGDAALMALPLNHEGNGIQMLGDDYHYEAYTHTCKNRVVERIEELSDVQGDKIRVYDKTDEAQGYTEYWFAEGNLHVHFNYTMQQNINPRQIGLVFTFPGDFQHLTWERQGQWNYYPEDQVGRLKGSANATNDQPISGPAGPVSKPTVAWAFDQNEYGTNDFRATKVNILTATLSNSFRKAEVISDGTQSVRCWLENGNTKMLVANYSNLGAGPLYRAHAELMDKPLKPGDTISGTVRLRISE